MASGVCMYIQKVSLWLYCPLKHASVSPMSLCTSTSCSVCVASACARSTCPCSSAAPPTNNRGTTTSRALCTPN